MAQRYSSFPSPAWSQSVRHSGIPTRFLLSVRILLRQGISYAEFSEIVKAVYVEVALKDFKVVGRRTTRTRIAVITGLTRKEVKRVIDEALREKYEPKTRFSRLGRVLVGCEFSGVVRRAFRKRGHDAWSCDLLPAEDGSPYHIQGDLLKILGDEWQLAIFHPPCTYLASSGARWFKGREQQQEQALDFVRLLLAANIPSIVLENPIGVISTQIRKPDQIVQPWWFGHGETKATCLWLKNLPPLSATNIVDGREQRIHKLPPSKDRGRLRSITYTGIAEAMADQWGSL